MAPRDPAKTARNELITKMKKNLHKMLPEVLDETGFASEASLNAVIGGKAAHFIDLHHAVILSPDQYITFYMKGFNAAMSPKNAPYPNTDRQNFERLKGSKAARKYFSLFLKRSYLKHFEELSRKRPRLSESEIWIGQNNANYGLFITPRFNKHKGEWENDRSEIRNFPRLYWTVGHAVQTGLVVPGETDKMNFDSVGAYLTFFKNVLVRASGSQYEKAIAKRYVEFVKKAKNPEGVPLLVPEFRYEGKAAKHKYRLDFCIIDPFTMQKVGFELSPWSTHGYLRKLQGLTQGQINDMAKDNFEKEMSKHKLFFKKHNVYALIYTDKDLVDMDAVFEDMKQYLEPVDEVVQLDFHLLEKFFDN
jgi:cellobiose-specific phosphotransferase system component IIB